MKAYVHKRQMVHSSCICNSQKLATTQTFISRGRDYQRCCIRTREYFSQQGRVMNYWHMPQPEWISKQLHKRIDTVHKMLENRNWYIVAKRRGEVARGWGAGFRKEGGIAKGTSNKDGIRGEGYVHGPDRGDGFTAEYMYKNVRCAQQKCAVYCMSAKLLEKRSWRREDFRVTLTFWVFTLLNIYLLHLWLPSLIHWNFHLPYPLFARF